jgi:hypothetical protein
MDEKRGREMGGEETSREDMAPAPAYSEDGVDLSLIRWMLSLTPAERLQLLQDHLEAIMRIRDANPHL